VSAALQQTIEPAVAALGYELVEVQRLAGGLLRVTIDRPWPAPDAENAAAAGITLQDCEKVSRQLQFELEVAQADYRRLEVSSPGLDRLLRHAQDFARFAGQVVDIVLKEPMMLDGAGRKRFRGVLQAAQAGDGTDGGGLWQIVFSDAPALKPGQRVGKKRASAQAGAVQVLGFALDELREARLAPVLDFKGRKPRAA